MSNIFSIVRSIQDIMRKDAGTYGDAQRLEQLGWMLFLKIFDDRERVLKIRRKGYQSPLPKALQWTTWALKDAYHGDGLVHFVNNTLLRRLKTVRGGSEKIAELVRNVFEDAINYMKSGALMEQVIAKINSIDFNTTTDRHTFGDIYEKLLRDLQSAGNSGEFYTPRPVTQFIVDRVNPKLKKRETILDPACGTGGFLTCVIDHLRRQAKTEADEHHIQKCFTGIEKKHLPHVLCMTNLLLHGIDVPFNVSHGNTLTRPLRDWRTNDRVNVIVTNPPFGGMEEDGVEYNYPVPLRTRETADLFLILMVHLLKARGRAGIVLPDSTLFGEGVKARIKEFLLKECTLHTIVRLPNGVFSPYTGIKTNLLFFTKGTPTQRIWYYDHPYPAGVKNYTKGRPVRLEEFEPIRLWWGNEEQGFKTRVENDRAWCVPIETIKERNFNLDLPNPRKSTAPHGEVSDLLPEYELLLQKIAETKAALKAELQIALEHSPKLAE